MTETTSTITTTTTALTSLVTAIRDDYDDGMAMLTIMGEMDVATATEIGRIVSEDDAVESLSFDHGCHMGPDQVVAVCEKLESSMSLRALGLLGAKAGVAGAEAIGKLMTRVPLMWLDLRFNDVNDDGAIALAEGIRKSGRMRTIDLVSNEIGSRGGIALARGIVGSPTIHTIYLADNLLRDAAAVALLNAAMVSPSLVMLDLRANDYVDVPLMRKLSAYECGCAEPCDHPKSVESVLWG